MRIRVDLPHPDAPTMETNSPVLISALNILQGELRLTLDEERFAKITKRELYAGIRLHLRFNCHLEALPAKGE